ncbi:hypothetical protein KKC88_00470 [Patescibacteria group bacterium]|nr:hypothetical protein [Patescibacteria group bacterium]MBU1674043.1 hypothetical protein [Patescibacteria group bacterium]MBU1963191.1 hypothetical protein [Patescibacteria group bacterium]
MAEEKKGSTQKYGRGALFIPAGIILGMGVGFLIDNLVGGMFVGLGLGFLAFAIVAVFVKDK